MVLDNNTKEPIDVEDFMIGSNVVILGRNLHVFDCDQYTREYFSNIGKVQPEPEEKPSDDFQKGQIKPPKFRDPDMKNYMEHSLGGGKVQSQKQFLDNDRKVLRYFCVSEDLPYILHYYLADDTIEIREVHFPNNGRD